MHQDDKKKVKAVSKQIRIAASVHYHLKLRALEEGRTMSDLANELIAGCPIDPEEEGELEGKN